MVFCWYTVKLEIDHTYGGKSADHPRWATESSDSDPQHQPLKLPYMQVARQWGIMWHFTKYVIKCPYREGQFLSSHRERWLQLTSAFIYFLYFSILLQSFPLGTSRDMMVMMCGTYTEGGKRVENNRALLVCMPCREKCVGSGQHSSLQWMMLTFSRVKPGPREMRPVGLEKEMSPLCPQREKEATRVRERSEPTRARERGQGMELGSTAPACQMEGHEFNGNRLRSWTDRQA